MSSQKQSPGENESNSSIDPAHDPNMVRVFDAFGRELFITKQAWKDNVLIGNLEKNKDDPDQLYDMLIGALEDGFAKDVVPYAERLQRIDPIPSRGAVVLGIVYMKTGRLDEAQHGLEQFVRTQGEDGVVLTNLAKVYAARGNQVASDATLWRALELDPNQDNALLWYVAIEKERSGEAGELAAFQRISAFPGSWRSRLWLARFALEKKDLPAAERFYSEVMSMAPRPIPSDILMQMSGDLGSNGFLEPLLRLIQPHFDVKIHDLMVGNNLIKANLELGRIENAQDILNQLYAQKRPDWQQTLRYWDTELSKADIARRKDTLPNQIGVSLVSIDGPLWTRDKSLFAKLMPAKSANAFKVAVIGGTALIPDSPASPEIQLSDGPGRLSRAIPLILGEQIHLRTDAVGLTVIPWAEDGGFALLGFESDDKSICDSLKELENSLNFVVAITVDTRSPDWKLSFRLLQMNNGKRIGDSSVSFPAQNPGTAVAQIIESLFDILRTRTGIQLNASPYWYQLPAKENLSNYLLRLEQLLAVSISNAKDFNGGNLSGEREIIDGTMQLCLSEGRNSLIRMLFAQTLGQMRQSRPDILEEFREKVKLLQAEYPLSGEVGQLVQLSIFETFRHLEGN